MMEEAKENRVTMAASDHTLMGKRVFTGTPNVKLIIVISLFEQRRSEAVVPEASIKNLRPFSCFVNTLARAKDRLRSFHRVGVAIAGSIIAVGLIGTAMIRLDLLETLGAETFAIVAGFALVLLGAIAIAAYGVVRAIEWASRG
jgi:hypothetical protein